VEHFLDGLAAVLGADRACAEVGRVLRLAGSYNRKNKAEPKLVRIVEMNQ